jgi:prolyl-tRNA editing enzyme YbaK/EbsC (Cys-tRNA(Pro) deacylase)
VTRTGVDAAVLEALDATGVDYEVIDCDPALADTAAFCEHYGYAPEDSANTIVVASKKDPKQYVACVVLATTRLDVNGTVKRRLGAGKVSFASAEETAALTGMAIGGVTALALPDGLPLWVDAAVMARPRIILGGGSRSMKIHVDPSVLTRLPGSEVVEGLAS